MIDRAKAWTRKYEQRVYVLDVDIGISIPFVDPTSGDLTIKSFKLIWDTGATITVISPRVAHELGLKPIDQAQVHTAGGSGQKNVYLVNLHLPNNTSIQGVRVIEADLISQGIDGLIGMDVIGLGDFSVTHFNDKSVVTFRMPSCSETDYVQEHSDHIARALKETAADEGAA